jgi:hypothetical protein
MAEFASFQRCTQPRDEDRRGCSLTVPGGETRAQNCAALSELGPFRSEAIPIPLPPPSRPRRLPPAGARRAGLPSSCALIPLMRTPRGFLAHHPLPSPPPLTSNLARCHRLLLGVNDLEHNGFAVTWFLLEPRRCSLLFVDVAVCCRCRGGCFKGREVLSR